MKSYRRRSQLSLYPKQFARSAFSVFALCVLCAFVENTPAQEFKQMHPGVEYAQVVHKIAEDPVKINLLRLDLTKVRLDVHHAFDRAIGLETTSSIAKRKGGVAAINAGFFRLDKSPFAGEAAGLLVIDHNVLSESHQSRAVLMIGNFASSTLVGFDSPDVWVLYVQENELST